MHDPYFILLTQDVSGETGARLPELPRRGAPALEAMA